MLRKWKRQAPKSVSATTPIYGGHIEGFAEFLRTAIDSRPLTLTPAVMRALAHNHGAAYPEVPEVLRYLDEDPR